MRITPYPQNAEPRWPALIALVAIGGLYAALPASLLISGPRWMLMVVVLVLLVPTAISHRIGHHSLNQILGYVLNAVVRTRWDVPQWAASG